MGWFGIVLVIGFIANIIYPLPNYRRFKNGEGNEDAEGTDFREPEWYI